MAVLRVLLTALATKISASVKLFRLVPDHPSWPALLQLLVPFEEFVLYGEVS